MNRRPAIKTTKKEIIDYWKYKVDESDISVDWSDADVCCWRCGCEKKLERCHIVPYSLGGEDKPSNFVLLCKGAMVKVLTLMIRNLCGIG